MSMNTTVSKLEKKYKNRIIACLYQNGCSYDDVTLLLNSKLKDVADIIDLEDIFY